MGLGVGGGREGDGMKAISAGWRPQFGPGVGGGREGDGMKAISAGWRPKSRAGGRWDEGYISRLKTAV